MGLEPGQLKVEEADLEKVGMLVHKMYHLFAGEQVANVAAALVLQLIYTTNGQQTINLTQPQLEKLISDVALSVQLQVATIEQIPA